MKSHLYSAIDNQELNQQLSPIVKAKDTLIEKNGAVVLNVDSMGMFSDIKDIFTKEQESKPSATTFFTTGKGKIVFTLDNTIFSPVPVVLLSGKQFEEKYLKQLEAFIFNNHEQLDPDKLINLIFLFDYIKKDIVPITITTGKHKKLLPRIVSGLNTFFTKNYSVIASIHVMFSGMSQIQTNTENTSD